MRHALLLACLVATFAAACADEDLMPVPTPRGVVRSTVGPKAVATGTPKAFAFPTPKALPQIAGGGALPTPAPRPQSTDPPAEPSTLLAAAPFPDNLAVVVQTVNCWGCDGGPVSIVRAYRDPSGKLRVETLLSQSWEPATARLFLWRTVAHDRWGIATTSCLGDGCLGLLTISARQQAPRRDIIVHRSLDGGVSWTEQPVESGRGQQAALIAGDRVLLWENVQEPPTRTAPARLTTRFFLHPSGREVAAPFGSSFPIAVGLRHLVGAAEGPLFLWAGEPTGPDAAPLRRLAWQHADGSVR
jgi:hypothetical protein